MPLRATDTTIKVADNDVSPSVFTRLVEHYLVHVPLTREIEQEGLSIIQGCFPGDNLQHFIQRVCKWGGHPGIAVRILKRNRIEDIQEHFTHAMDALNKEIPDIVTALRTINRISGLGKPSFASKHLRFLRPDVCPVLDNLLSEALTYSLDTAGYKQFASDCLQVANTLQRYTILNPMRRTDKMWFAADVEMAIYIYTSWKKSRPMYLLPELVHDNGSEFIAEDDPILKLTEHIISDNGNGVDDISEKHDFYIYQ